jgi:CheY-like chemotaxis protein
MSLENFPPTGRRILVVEDDPDGRTSLRELLGLWGHEVEVAPDGPRGVERALAARPDVVMVDIVLPLLSGYEVGRRVRAGLGEGVLLIALTGRGRPVDRDRALASGFDVHFAKPVEPATLHRLLDKPPELVRASAHLIRELQELQELRPGPPRLPTNGIKVYRMRCGGVAVRVFESSHGLALFRAADPAPGPRELTASLDRAVERWLRSRPRLRLREKRPVRRGGRTVGVYLHYELGEPC